MNKLLRLGRAHAPDVVALSARLDGALDARVAARLEEHLASCHACRAALAALRSTREALRALPELDAPRSFRLRAADVQRASVAPARPATPMLRWAPAFAAAAAAVFVIALAADLRSDGAGLRTASAPSAARQATQAESADSAGFAAGKSAPGGEAMDGVATAPALVPSEATTSDTIPLAPGPPAPGPAGAASATPSSAAPANAISTEPDQDGRPPSSPDDGTLTTALDAGESDGGNHTWLLRVIESVAAAAALSAAVTMIVWRTRGGRS